MKATAVGDAESRKSCVIKQSYNINATGVDIKIINMYKFKLLCEFIQNNALKEHGEPIYEAKVPQPLL